MSTPSKTKQTLATAAQEGADFLMSAGLVIRRMIGGHAQAQRFAEVEARLRSAISSEEAHQRDMQAAAECVAEAAVNIRAYVSTCPRTYRDLGLPRVEALDAAICMLQNEMERIR